MQSLKRHSCVAFCVVALVAIPGCGSKQIDYEAVTYDQLTPEQQQQMNQLHEEANRAAATGQPLPPDVITEEMLTSGMLQDGVLLTPEQYQQMQRQQGQ
jgi:Spy/CpxP family protein refolding chaperone